MNPTDPPTPRPTGPRGALKRTVRFYSTYVSDTLSPSNLVLLLIACLLVTVTLVGGWRRATAAEDLVPTAHIGESVTASPFQVAASTAQYGSELGTVVRAQSGVRLLVVKVSVTNIADRYVSGYALSRAFRVDATGLREFGALAKDSDVAPVMYRVLDSQPCDLLQPGVPVDLALVWEQQASAPLPSELTLTVSGLTWRNSSLDSSSGWFDATEAVRYHLPLAPLPKA